MHIPENRPIDRALRAFLAFESELAFADPSIAPRTDAPLVLSGEFARQLQERDFRNPDVEQPFIQTRVLVPHRVAGFVSRTFPTHQAVVCADHVMTLHADERDRLSEQYQRAARLDDVAARDALGSRLATPRLLTLAARDVYPSRVAFGSAHLAIHVAGIVGVFLHGVTTFFEPHEADQDAFIATGAARSFLQSIGPTIVSYSRRPQSVRSEFARFARHAPGLAKRSRRSSPEDHACIDMLDRALTFAFRHRPALRDVLPHAVARGDITMGVGIRDVQDAMRGIAKSLDLTQHRDMR
jgi:hypothetical protein